MEGGAIFLAGACLAFVAGAWKAWRKHRAREMERHLMLELYDAVVVEDDTEAPERLLRIRALRVLVNSLAAGELRSGLLRALDLQESALPEPDEKIESAIDVLLESCVMKIARRELGARSERLLPDTPSLISRFVREMIRDWRALSLSRASTADAELQRRAEEMAQLELLLDGETTTTRFPQTPQFISRLLRDLIRDWRALKDFPRNPRQ